MDVSFNNVLEGTRQYFLGLPKQVPSEGAAQPMWPAGAQPPEEGAPALSGAPAPSSRPPSAAAAPPSTSGPPTPVPPPRPPSEPLEPEPHIIHKATVMREALEKRREQPDPEDDDETNDALSPPSHIIRKPPTRRLPSPAPAPAAPCPSPARPPSAAPAPPENTEPQPPYRPHFQSGQTPTARQPDHYIAGRPPDRDPHTASRPPETYVRQYYETPPDSGRSPHPPPASIPHPIPRQSSQQTYGRLSSSVPMHTAVRMRDTPSHSPPTQRYMPPQQPPQPPPHNDRVPPIHHPSTLPPTQRITTMESRTAQAYASTTAQRRAPSPYGRQTTHYDRHHPSVAPRKYDAQQAYPGYRPTSSAPQPVQSHRVEPQHPLPYKNQSTVEGLSARYGTRPPERAVPAHPRDTARLPRVDYPRNVDSRSYQYPSPSTSTSRYGPTPPAPVHNSTMPSRSSYRPPPQKPAYEYVTTNNVQTSPARPTTQKPNYTLNQPSRMTVSVTSLVNQMNQTKHKRESPLDLSVKTVKNSADSSTTQDDIVDSASVESKTVSLQQRPTSSSRHAPAATGGFASSHKVDFAPDFSQYRERFSNPSYSQVSPSQHPPAGHPLPGHPLSGHPPPGHPTSGHPHLARPSAGGPQSGQSPSGHPPSGHSPSGHPPTGHLSSGHPPSVHPPSIRYNGAFEPPRHGVEYPGMSRTYPDCNKYGQSLPTTKNEYVHRIDLTKPVPVERHSESRLRDDRHFIIEERKRTGGPIVNNIPEKMVRYETWTDASRIDRINQSAREQKRLMTQPVYSYSSHKHFEPYQHDNKSQPVTNIYKDPHHHLSSRFPYTAETQSRQAPEYHAPFLDRNPSSSSRHVIQKAQSHREIPPHHHHNLDRSGVLSILRNSLETKQTGLVEPARPARQVPDLIVIDDVDDSVIEITDLTKEEVDLAKKQPRKGDSGVSPVLDHAQISRAIDPNAREAEHRVNNLDPNSRSPENDVTRIRTKAELKSLPPPQEARRESSESEKGKLVPKSQKQHLFNQIRKDNLRFDSVIKSESSSDAIIPEVKSEPMNIDEIEKDAEIPIKIENILDPEPVSNELLEDDLDWATACDSFVEQLMIGCHKKKPKRKRIDTDTEKQGEKQELEKQTDKHNQEKPISQLVEKITPTMEQKSTVSIVPESKTPSIPLPVENIKKEPLDEDSEMKEDIAPPPVVEQIELKEEMKLKEHVKPNEQGKSKQHETVKDKEQKKEKRINKTDKELLKSAKTKTQKSKEKKVKENLDKGQEKTPIVIKQEKESPIKTVIKEESESTDDDEPLIKSKILKEKEETERMKYQLLKDLSDKTAYVKLECFDAESIRKSLDSSVTTKEKETQPKTRLTRQVSKTKGKSTEGKKDKPKEDTSSSDSDDDIVASRLRVRKSIKTEDLKENKTSSNKTSVKSSPKKQESRSCNSTPVRKPGFGDGSDFHPGWEEELYRYKRSLRMPTRLIAIPRGRSGGPFVRGSSNLFARGSTSLPDLDPTPLSPAPSSNQSAATDDLYARRPDKPALDSDLESNSSYSALNRLQYDSEASTSTVLSSNKFKKKASSIVDVLIRKCGRKDDKKKGKDKPKDDDKPKVIPKNANELLPTPSLDLGRNGTTGSLGANKDKIMDDVFYFGAFRKETVSAFRNHFLNKTDGLIGATEEFAPVVLKTRTRTESRVLKQRATIKEVFGDERPASAPPLACRTEEDQVEKEEPIVIKKEKDESEAEGKLKPKTKKILKDKILRRSSSIRDGLRSTKSLKRNDAKGRLMRLKKRNNLITSLANKRIKDFPSSRPKKEKPQDEEGKEKDSEKEKEQGVSVPPPDGTKKRFKRLFGRRKFSSGFDYIRKKKKIIRREDGVVVKKMRRPAPKPNPESVHDIHKEIKGWFVNKSIGETSLHRAARLGYTVSFCTFY